MAIQTLSFISLILRPWVKQEIDPNGLAYLLNLSNPNKNYDGEIMAFGSMSGRDMDETINHLSFLGYNQPDIGEDSDMIISDMFGNSYVPPWLELVNVTFFDETRSPVEAWKKKDSSVNRLLNFESNKDVPIKGYECDWHPHIGDIR
jgi:hypothetical protein